MSLKSEKTLREELDLTLSNSICSASSAISDIGKLNTLTYNELINLAAKYGISTEEKNG